MFFYGVMRCVRRKVGKPLWNDEVKEATSRNRRCMAMCRNSTEEKNRHKSMKMGAKKIILKNNQREGQIGAK